jgi:hypothetical protein
MDCRGNTGPDCSGGQLQLLRREPSCAAAGTDSLPASFMKAQLQRSNFAHRRAPLGLSRARPAQSSSASARSASYSGVNWIGGCSIPANVNNMRATSSWHGADQTTASNSPPRLLRGGGRGWGTGFRKLRHPHREPHPRPLLVKNGEGRRRRFTGSRGCRRLRAAGRRRRLRRRAASTTSIAKSRRRRQ